MGGVFLQPTAGVICFVSEACQLPKIADAMMLSHLSPHPHKHHPPCPEALSFSALVIGRAISPYGLAHTHAKTEHPADLADHPPGDSEKATPKRGRRRRRVRRCYLSRAHRHRCCVPSMSMTRKNRRPSMEISSEHNHCRRAGKADAVIRR